MRRTPLARVITVFAVLISCSVCAATTQWTVHAKFAVSAGQNSPANPPAAQSGNDSNQARRAQLGDADVSAQKDVAYGNVDGQALLLDVFAPIAASQKPRPAVILIHGGGWVAFDKSTLTNMGKFLARMGYVAFSVNYRLLNGTKNQWPAQLDDVQRAVRWVRANATKYDVDSEHIGTFGHSAGAQLASLLGMEDTRDNSDAALAKYSSRVQAVIDVSGPTDFARDHDADGDAFLAKFFGGDLETHGDAWRDASPVFHVAKNDAPFLILHGTKDQDVQIAQAEELSEKLKAAGVPVKLVKVDDVHTFVTPEAKMTLLTETIKFLQKNLGEGQMP